ncbi:lytic polysaccharide monooxygenase [Metapseudomonas furukawaii]|uniref:lytic polysaccharide monooxygenase n=1 Tax=Metapseudomonas furukawaii TaxID=1149133 RepID=UPI004046709E
MSNTQRSLRKLPLALAVGLAALASQQAFSHGYIETPKSRAMLCAAVGGNQNANCGPIQYEPQSIEYGPHAAHQHKGAYCGGSFMECGPADGFIPAGGLNGIGQLNEQTATRWTKTTIKPGPMDFVWKYTAGHATAYWEFYITKKDWNPNKPLTRDSFESTPLLHEAFSLGLNPKPRDGGRSTHRLNIPADRSGYHVILATWRIADTANTFYQTVDVNIEKQGGGVTPPAPTWNVIGAVQPETLQVGDTVRARVFTQAGEQAGRQVELRIESDNQAQADNWPYLLAQKVNAANLGYKMGELNKDGEVVPNYGRNSIQVKADSDVVRVEIQKEQPSVPSSLDLTGLASSYQIKDGKADLHFNAIAHGGDFTVDATVYNAKGESIAYQHQDRGNTPHFHMSLDKAEAGAYDLVVIATPKKGDPLQKTHSFTLLAEQGVEPPVPDDRPGDDRDPGEVEQPGHGGHYQHVFPEGLKGYTAGTTVLARDGNRYECLPFPNSGYCVQWSPSANQYEPGVGLYWKMAWKRL